MADVSRNSTSIADLVATPQVKGQPIRAGVDHTKISEHTYVSGDSAPSLGVLLRVPAHSRIKNLTISHLDFTTAGVIDVGVHAETSPGVAGAAIDADFFANDYDLAAVTVKVDKLSILNQSGTNTVTKQTQALWQALGVTTEPVPGTFYLITSTVVTTINSTALNIAYEVDYIL